MFDLMIFLLGFALGFFTTMASVIVWALMIASRIEDEYRLRIDPRETLDR